MYVPALYKISFLLILLSGMCWGLFINDPPLSMAQSPSIVYVVPVKGVIDMGLAPFVERVLQEATDAKSQALILDINTFGGRVDAAVIIRDALLTSKIPTVAFINKRAISAGALISLATERIIMAEGATIGAATPVQMGLPGTSANTASEKTISYIRKEFRGTAESRKRPPLLAEAMVDADVVIPDVIARGKLLTLTTKEALNLTIADLQANSLESVLQSLNLSDAEIRHATQTWAESLVRFLTHPLVSSLLMTMGMLGLFIEMRAPGFGIPGVLGLMSLILFFGGHGLVHLAGWEELLFVGLGLIGIGLEIFVVPGFGVAGILGIVSLLAGFALSLIGAGASWEAIVTSIGQVALSIILAIVLGLLLLRFLPHLPLGNNLVLKTALLPKEEYDSNEGDYQPRVGTKGIVASALRPSGIAHFDGERLDVVSEGEFIEAGQSVTIVQVDGNRIVVRQIALGEKERGKS